MDREQLRTEAWERDKALRAKSPDLDDQTIWFPDWTQGFDAGWDVRDRLSAWVAVSDRLPICNGFCLVSLDGGQVCEAYYWAEFQLFSRGMDGYNRIPSVTHWREMPAPFTVEENKV